MIKAIRVIRVIPGRRVIQVFRENQVCPDFLVFPVYPVNEVSEVRRVTRAIPAHPRT